MYIVARNHLESVAKNIVGIPIVDFLPQEHSGGRRCSIVTVPQKGILDFDLKHYKERVKKYRDWDDLTGSPATTPKIKYRTLKAGQVIAFQVQLSNTTAEGVNDDFKDFMRNLGKFIYDGQTAKYIDPQGVNQTDTTGNKIKVVPTSYDFNDNKAYGELTNQCFIDIEFHGGIYVVPDPASTTRDVPDTWLIPESTITT